MSCHLSLTSHSPEISSRSFNGPDMTHPMYRLRALSIASQSSDDASGSSTTSFSDNASVTSSSSSSSFSYDPRRCISALAIHSPSPELASVSSISKYAHKSGTEHVLIRARNANIPALFRHQQKKDSTAGRRRQTRQDSDYEESNESNTRRPKKQKTKSSEQIEAEERRMVKRKAELENDTLLDASRMFPDKVWCIPCDKYIQIDSRRQYYATLWYKHRGKRHPGVPLKRSELSGSDTTPAVDLIEIQ